MSYTPLCPQETKFIIDMVETSTTSSSYYSNDYPHFSAFLFSHLRVLDVTGITSMAHSSSDSLEHNHFLLSQQCLFDFGVGIERISSKTMESYHHCGVVP